MEELKILKEELKEALINPPNLEGKICKVISDGTPAGTKVYGPDGSPLPFIEALTITLDINHPLARMTVTMLAAVEMEAEVTEVYYDKQEIYL